MPYFTAECFFYIYITIWKAEEKVKKTFLFAAALCVLLASVTYAAPVKFIDNSHYQEISTRKAGEMFSDGKSFIALFYSAKDAYCQTARSVYRDAMDTYGITIYGVNLDDPMRNDSDIEFMWEQFPEGSAYIPILVYVDDKGKVKALEGAGEEDEILSFLGLGLTASVPSGAGTEYQPVKGNDKTVVLTAGYPFITVNGSLKDIDGAGTAPELTGSELYVPFVAFFNAMNISCEWDGETGTATGVYKGGVYREVTMAFTLDSRTAYINGEAVEIGAAPYMLNNWVMVPASFIAKAVGADISYDYASKTLTIIERDLFMAVGGVKIALGNTEEQVVLLLGKPDRVDQSPYLFDWYVYNSDYSKFIMVGIRNGIVEGLYSNVRGFYAAVGNYGDIGVKSPDDRITFYFDKHENDKIHACLIVSEYPNHYREDMHTDEIFLAQELENFDATNVFRVNYGLKAVKPDETAVAAARNHSRDMADRDYFAHESPEGSTFVERYKAVNGINTASGENLHGGYMLGVSSFSSLLNSLGHRENMLAEGHRYLGVGFAYNPDSTYKYYTTQLFSR